MGNIAMKKKFLATATTLSLIAMSSGAFDFKGVALNTHATPQELKDALGVSCVSDPQRSALLRTACLSPDATIVGEKALLVVFVSEEGVVTQIMVEFDPSDFDMVESAVLEKYGIPSNTTRDVIKNRMGAEFKNTRHEWHDKSGSIMVLSRFRGSLTESLLHMFNSRLQEQLNADTAEKKKDL